MAEPGAGVSSRSPIATGFWRASQPRNMATSAPVVGDPNRGARQPEAKSGQKRTSGEDASPVKITRQQPGVRHGGQGDVQSCGSLLDYEAAARYLCTTPTHVRELWAKRQLAASRSDVASGSPSPT